MMTHDNSAIRNPKSEIVPTAVLLGGGIESTALVKRFLAAGETVLPVRVACGLLWDECESVFARRFCEANVCDCLQPLIEIKLPLHDFLGPHWAVTGVDIPRAGDATANLEIPLRNLTLLGFAVHRLKHLPQIVLALGTTADNSFRDGSREYFDRCQDVLALEAGRPVSILTPFIRHNKAQVIRETDRVTLALSFSCVNPQQDRHCGTCIKCGRRQAAFREAGVDDPTEYVGG